MSLIHGRRSLLLASLASMADIANAQSPVRRVPVIFIGHGSPMNAISENPFTRALQAWARRCCGRPRFSRSRPTGSRQGRRW